MALNELLNLRLQELSLFNMYGFDMMSAFGIRGVQSGNKFGQIPFFDPADGRIPVWEGANPYQYQTSAFTPSFASNNANDTLLGTGARVIVVIGNDPEGNEQEETINLNGQTPVVSTKTWSIVYRMYVNEVGTGGTAAGQIYCGLGVFIAGVPDTELAIIRNGNNQTQMCIFQVPKGFYCAITSISYTTIALKPVIYHNEVRFKSGPFDHSGPFRNTRTVNVDGSFSLQLQPYGVFPEYSDVRITALANQNDSTCEAAFRYILIPKKLIERFLT